MTALLQSRQQQGVTRTWLASQLGISRSTLWRYERGEVDPPKSVLFHAAHLLHVPVSELTDAIHG